MARKAAQKPAAAPAAPLVGCIIATSGRFPGTTQSALQSRLTSLGAAVASSVTPDSNYLIATEKDYESNSTKVKEATRLGVPIVTVEWLDECESTGRLMHFATSSMLPNAYREGYEGLEADL